MTPSTESPFAAESTDAATAVADASDSAHGVSFSGATDDARPFPGRVRGQRLEITSADLTMYSVITGRAPSHEERERALGWAGTDPCHGEVANALAPASSTALLPGYAIRPWHPAALSLRVRELWFNGITLKTARPQLTQWFRRLSLALHEGRKRVTSSRKNAA